VLLETFRLNLQLVMSDRQFDQHVLSLMIRDRSTGQTGLGLLCSDRRRLNNRPARIQHSSANASGDLLRSEVQACKGQNGKGGHD
jgi:hypothetical protein